MVLWIINKSIFFHMDPDLVSTCFYLSSCKDLDSAFFVKSEIYSTRKVPIRAGLLSNFSMGISSLSFYSVEHSYKRFLACAFFVKNPHQYYYRRLLVLLVGQLSITGSLTSHFIMKLYFYKSLMTLEELISS